MVPTCTRLFMIQPHFADNDGLLSGHVFVARRMSWPFEILRLLYESEPISGKNLLPVASGTENYSWSYLLSLGLLNKRLCNRLHVLKKESLVLCLIAR